MHVHFEGECCVDCLVYIANGDVPDDRATLPSDIARNWPDQNVHLHAEDETAEFSRSDCDACGSSLAGSRHEFVVLCEHPECAPETDDD